MVLLFLTDFRTGPPPHSSLTLPNSVDTAGHTWVSHFLHLNTLNWPCVQSGLHSVYEKRVGLGWWGPFYRQRTISSVPLSSRGEGEYSNPQSVIFNYTFTFPHAGWSPVVWVNWSEMIKLGLSGSVNVSTEFGMYEISTFFSQFEGKFIKLTVSRVFYHRRPWLKALSNFNYALSRIINTQSLIQKPCIQEVLISLQQQQQSNKMSW